MAAVLGMRKTVFYVITLQSTIYTGALFMQDKSLFQQLDLS